MNLPMTREESVAYAESGEWRKLTDRERALIVFANKGFLCLPFAEFHKAIESALGRSVWTHEFGLNWNGLERELLGLEGQPTIRQIFDLIPEEKRIIIVADT